MLCRLRFALLPSLIGFALSTESCAGAQIPTSMEAFVRGARSLSSLTRGLKLLGIDPAASCRPPPATVELHV
jgi:hypothetical protein